MSNSAQLRSALAVPLAANVPVALRGDPGVGKTSMMTAAAEAAGWHLEVVVLSIREPVDVGGFPVVDVDGTVRLAPPRWAEHANRATLGALVMFDEITTGNSSARHAALRVLQERVAGETQLAPHVRLAAAYNDPDVCDGWELEPPIRSRMVHLDAHVDHDAFCDGLLHGFPAPVPALPPDDLDAALLSARAQVAGFIRRRPDLLALRPQPGSAGGYPCPRSWTNAARLLGWCDAMSVDAEIRHLLAAGCVGEGAAVELGSFLSELDLPDPLDLLANPDTHPLPERPDQLLVTMSAVVAAARDERSWLAAWKVLARVSAGNALDVAALLIPGLVRRCPSGVAIPPEARAIAALVNR